MSSYICIFVLACQGYSWLIIPIFPGEGREKDGLQAYQHKKVFLAFRKQTVPCFTMTRDFHQGFQPQKRTTQKNRSVIRNQPLVRPARCGQLLAKSKILGSEIRGTSEFRLNEQNKISMRFNHDYDLEGAFTIINNNIKYELLRRTAG